jgi:peptide-methionine (R)-S-oxide reductase
MKSEEDWQKELSREAYHVLREKGTEKPFSGKYFDHKETGVYVCAACGFQLFESKTKYSTGTGWPSFYAPMDSGRIDTEPDFSHGMKRTEVLCSSCGSHLGHVFEDGPPPSGLRYCINSISLSFQGEE